jgi:hypothetical protein
MASSNAQTISSYSEILLCLCNPHAHTHLQPHPRFDHSSFIGSLIEELLKRVLRKISGIATHQNN